MTEHADRKTIDVYAEDRAKLNALTAPVKFTFTGSGIDNDYRQHQKVEYLLGMVGHLLRRVDALESQLESRADSEAESQGSPADSALGA